MKKIVHVREKNYIHQIEITSTVIWRGDDDEDYSQTIERNIKIMIWNDGISIRDVREGNGSIFITRDQYPHLARALEIAQARPEKSERPDDPHDPH
jgi:hypothetical protein